MKIIVNSQHHNMMFHSHNIMWLSVFLDMLCLYNIGTAQEVTYTAASIVALTTSSAVHVMCCITVLATFIA
jgi:GH35 family endo-1,4-beta-xylanase